MSGKWPICISLPLFDQMADEQLLAWHKFVRNALRQSDLIPPHRSILNAYERELSNELVDRNQYRQRLQGAPSTTTR